MIIPLQYHCTVRFSHRYQEKDYICSTSLKILWANPSTPQARKALTSQGHFYLIRLCKINHPIKGISQEVLIFLIKLNINILIKKNNLLLSCRTSKKN